MHMIVIQFIPIEVTPTKGLTREERATRAYFSGGLTTSKLSSSVLIPSNVY